MPRASSYISFYVLRHVFSKIAAAHARHAAPPRRPGERMRAFVVVTMSVEEREVQKTPRYSCGCASCDAHAFEPLRRVTPPECRQLPLSRCRRFQRRCHVFWHHAISRTPDIHADVDVLMASSAAFHAICERRTPAFA